MKIRLIVTLPIELKHGAAKGREFDAQSLQDGSAWFLGDSGEKCIALPREYKIIES